ncbi:aldehyde dehydrogenase family protein [Klebsiella pneumoniae subsp. pneumoniae]|nr:aldehyde dehydrogenase family protein [Klebsiella pneumoniae subsp. pneumoniae]
MASRDFVPPTLIELDSFRRAEKEVFGPVLHVVRYNRNELDKLVEQINASGYGLTLGVHTRIDETIAQVTGSARWATCTSTAIWLARWSACSRSAAKGCPVPVRKPAVRCICTVCSPAVHRTRLA